MKKYIIWGAIGLLGLIIVVGAPLAITWYMIKDVKANQAAAAEKPAAEQVSVTKDNVVALKPFVTNLADTDKPRYVSITLELILQDPKQKAAVDEKVPLVRDTVISLLTSKKAQEVTGEAGANTLKNEIIARVNADLGGSIVQKVLITDLVVQN